MDSVELAVDTGTRRFADLTGDIRRWCAGRGEGLVNIFVPHATAGLAIFEKGSGSEADLAELLGRLIPRDRRYSHSHGSPGHGADHLLPALLSPSISIPVLGGSPQLGVWQSIVLVDLNADNPRRSLRVSFLEG